MILEFLSFGAEEACEEGKTWAGLIVVFLKKWNRFLALGIRPGTGSPAELSCWKYFLTLLATCCTVRLPRALAIFSYLCISCFCGGNSKRSSSSFVSSSEVHRSSEDEDSLGCALGDSGSLVLYFEKSISGIWEHIKI